MLNNVQIKGNGEKLRLKITTLKIILILYKLNVLKVGFNTSETEVRMTFHLTYVHIILVRFGLLSGHLFGNSCPLGRPYVLFVF